MSKSIKIIIKNSTVIINKNAKFNYPTNLLYEKKQEITRKKNIQSLSEDDDDYYEEILKRIRKNGGL